MRRLARLAAVQGLYQIALSAEPADSLIRRFRHDPGVLLQEEQTVIAVDADLFAKINRQKQISGLLRGGIRR